MLSELKVFKIGQYDNFSVNGIFEYDDETYLIIQILKVETFNYTEKIEVTALVTKIK
jgi:hypothetical protein